MHTLVQLMDIFEKRFLNNQKGCVEIINNSMCKSIPLLEAKNGTPANKSLNNAENDSCEPCCAFILTATVTSLRPPKYESNVS